MPPHSAESPAKKQSKWSPEEDALIIELRGRGLKWDDISKQLPGRSSISCRLHYQNYLERRSEWDEERKNKLARLYERFKPEMWAKVAEEMQVPWRAAEAMHWQLGEADMARRAGVVPFSLSSISAEPPLGARRGSPGRGHGHHQHHHHHSHSQSGYPGGRYGRGTAVPPPPPPPPPQPPALAPIPPLTPGMPPPMAGPRPLAARRESGPPRYPGHPDPGEAMFYGPGGPGLAPIQSSAQGRGGMLLPGVAELTTGVSPYSTPAYSIGGVPTASPAHSATASPGPLFPPLFAAPYQGQEPAGGGSSGKRRASPTMGPQETSRRRHLDPR